MADLLRITTPLITKNPAQTPKQPEPNADLFTLTELTKVVKSTPQSELLRQNNGLMLQGEPSSALINLLKDPAAAMGFLRSISMLQEVVGLLPLNNQTVTPEIRQMFEALFIAPEDIVLELKRQENSTTIFKGPFFDLIRDVLRDSDSPDQIDASLRLLKAVNGMLDRRDVFDSVSNSLRFLSDSLSSSHGLSAKLASLADSFRKPDAEERLPSLKAEILPLFKEIESSVLFGPKLARILPLITYNLSRYNGDPDYLPETAERFYNLLEDGQAKESFLSLLRGVLQRPGNAESPENSFPWGTASGRAETDVPYSQVMDLLTRIISEESRNEKLSPSVRAKLEKVIYSLLSSPSNFTPLLHYIIPVKYENINAFAELWIDPNGEEAAEASIGRGGIHLLAVFDVAEIGQFEAELFLRDRSIDLNLFCPPPFTSFFRNAEKEIGRSLGGTGYQFGKVRIEDLTRIRSLIEVFTALPYRRMGIDTRA